MQKEYKYWVLISPKVLSPKYANDSKKENIGKKVNKQKKSKVVALW